MTRIMTAIERTAKLISNRLVKELLTQEQLDKWHKDLDIQLDEYIMYQELKSLAMIHNKLTTEEAIEIYGYLGNTPEHFNKQPIEVKLVLTKILSELLTWEANGIY